MPGLTSALPFLADAQAVFFCRVQKSLSHGDHGVFVADVEGVRMREQTEPLVFQDGRLAAARLPPPHGLSTPRSGTEVSLGPATRRSGAYRDGTCTRVEGYGPRRTAEELRGDLAAAKRYAAK